MVIGVEPIDFGGALKALKEGKAVAREGWNGKGLFIYLVEGGDYQVQMDIVKSIAGEKGTLHYNPYLAIRNVDGNISTWVPSINDCLAEDWHTVVPEREILKAKQFLERNK